MRRKNLRVALVGVVLFVIAIVFFLFMLAIAPRSNDPVELLRTVGMVSGTVGGLAIAMTIGGLVGKKA
jgi:asparagine N-glycosylation enzyme membrane subunit Stt3